MKCRVLLFAAIFTVFASDKGLYSQDLEIAIKNSNSNGVEPPLKDFILADTVKRTIDNKTRFRNYFIRNTAFGIEGSYLDFVDSRSKGFNLGVHASLLINNDFDYYYYTHLIDLSLTAGGIFGERTYFNPKIALQSVQVFRFNLGINLGVFLEHYGNYGKNIVGFRYGPILGLNLDGLLNVNYQYGYPIGDAVDNIGQHQLTIGLKLNLHTVLSIFYGGW